MGSWKQRFCVAAPVLIHRHQMVQFRSGWIFPMFLHNPLVDWLFPTFHSGCLTVWHGEHLQQILETLQLDFTLLFIPSPHTFCFPFVKPWTQAIIRGGPFFFAHEIFPVKAHDITITWSFFFRKRKSSWLLISVLVQVSVWIAPPPSFS